MKTIDIIVSDIDASRAFYRRLGLDFEVDATYPDHAGFDTSNGLHVMLDTEKFAEMARPPGGPRVFFCFELPTPQDVDARYAELVEAGHKGVKEPWDAFWGQRYATVLDPDGNGIDLYAILPQS